THIYTLSLHDALPISRYIRLNCLRHKIIHQLYMLISSRMKNKLRTCFFKYSLHTRTVSNICNQYTDLQILPMIRQFQLYIIQWRSEEHTSELQSRFDL